MEGRDGLGMGLRHGLEDGLEAWGRRMAGLEAWEGGMARAKQWGKERES